MIKNKDAFPSPPKILQIKTVAQSRLFKIEALDLEFSNGVKRSYERMSPSARQSVLIVPVLGDELLLIHEYAAGTERYEMGFPKGLVDPGESVLAAANRELMEEVGFGANKLTVLARLSMSPSYFSSTMTLILAEDLYPQKQEGDEPEPLIISQCPINEMMALLDRPDFTEARNVSALFLAHRHLNNRQ